ncbi:MULTISPECIES: hypothetical protein [Synechocystis]|uniref:Uncharacterized protein n=1 Tax=Synechocystis salina LEGE 00031 TaxID=1828736 RepID=A0ABR9VWR4_9SYNC|nr:MULTISPECIES: hypothetical protein [Synechocystis]MBE9196858.1 hypothetical protein [Synechocystis sp. LEGE 06083]MBE9242898.1 hypothetical protein [Synechocystis salina LEGE 00041]MBE9255797.1 hypothetical protein [Synechocystis salina LEGE 00031]
MSLLADYLNGVYTYPSDFALSDLFWANFGAIYGTEYDFAKAEAICTCWTSGNFGAIPPIEFINREVG